MNALPLFLLAGLSACATTQPLAERMTLTGLTPRAADRELSQDAPADAIEAQTLPLGIGFTAGPTTTMLAAGLDIPVEGRVTAGPSLQFGFDDDWSIVTLTGQVKYFLPMSGESRPTVMPYVCAGVGLAHLDRDRGGDDLGLALSGGAGLRYLTGEQYRLGSEARLYLLPDDLAGEHSFWTFELLQFVVTF